MQRHPAQRVAERFRAQRLHPRQEHPRRVAHREVRTVAEAVREVPDERRGRREQQRDAGALHGGEDDEADAPREDHAREDVFQIPGPRLAVCGDGDEVQRVAKHRDPLPLQAGSAGYVAVPQRPFALRERLVLDVRIRQECPHHRAEIAAFDALHDSLLRARHARKSAVKRARAVVRRDEAAAEKNHGMAGDEHASERSAKERGLWPRARPCGKFCGEPRVRAGEAPREERAQSAEEDRCGEKFREHHAPSRPEIAGLAERTFHFKEHLHAGNEPELHRAVAEAADHFPCHRLHALNRIPVQHAARGVLDARMAKLHHAAGNLRLEEQRIAVLDSHFHAHRAGSLGLCDLHAARWQQAHAAVDRLADLHRSVGGRCDLRNEINRRTRRIPRRERPHIHEHDTEDRKDDSGDDMRADAAGNPAEGGLCGLGQDGCLLRKRRASGDTVHNFSFSNASSSAAFHFA